MGPLAVPQLVFTVSVTLEDSQHGFLVFKGMTDFPTCLLLCPFG